jgi:RNA polymerase sigma-70 factor (ECF subfamily)
VAGAERVLRWLQAGLERPESAGFRFGPVEINGQLAMAAGTPDELDSVDVLRVDDGRITELYLIRNPDELIGISIDLSRR